MVFGPFPLPIQYCWIFISLGLMQDYTYQWYHHPRQCFIFSIPGLLELRFSIWFSQKEYFIWFHALYSTECCCCLARHSVRSSTSFLISYSDIIVMTKTSFSGQILLVWVPYCHWLVHLSYISSALDPSLWQHRALMPLLVNRDCDPYSVLYSIQAQTCNVIFCLRIVTTLGHSVFLME